MINSYSNVIQNVASGNNVLFTNDRVRTQSCNSCCGWLAHDLGSGIFTLTKGGIYRISYNANITSTTTGQASLVLEQNGEAIIGSQSDYTIETASAYGNVSADIYIKVPCNASYTITLTNNTTLALSISDANISIERVA